MRVGLGVGLTRHRRGGAPAAAIPPATAYYTFDSAFHDESGDNFRDDTGNGHDGTNADGTSYGLPARIGDGALHGGSDAVPSLASLFDNPPWTITAWVYSPTGVSDGAAIQFLFASFTTQIALSNSQVFVTTDDGSRISSLIPDDTWIHVAVVQDGFVRTAYFDGVAESPGPYVMASVGSFRIEANAAIDEVGLFESALTEEQIGLLVAGGRPPNVP